MPASHAIYGLTRQLRRGDCRKTGDDVFTTGASFVYITHAFIIAPENHPLASTTTNAKLLISLTQT
ncbi:hypothetical protein OUZ56_027608 [Daphnia magna]|uniref:Uncharacterized protein n=1 Tax=Daphnia magna TaxID=35525 RepID=A0ABR0B225_9CRUS|nr:hypothetical protein OUZ56_027608 [Daphnia magna]